MVSECIPEPGKWINVFEASGLDHAVENRTGLSGQIWKPDGHVAIPMGARPSAQSLIPRAMFLKELRSRKDVFLGDFSKKPTWKLYPYKGIFQRVMYGKHLRLFCLLRGEKVTKPIWNFAGQVEVAADMYFEHFYADIDEYRRNEILTDIYLRQPSWKR